MHIKCDFKLFYGIMNTIILSFGANISGIHGKPLDCFLNALQVLENDGMIFKKISSLYLSPSIGAAYLPPFYNFVAICSTRHHPNRLMRKFKQLERASGRRGSLYWGARPLDIDIIDFNGTVLNWSFLNKNRMSRLKKRHSNITPLVYPHKDMHKRAFVLKPLIEVLPTWRHPVFGQSAGHLMRLHCSHFMIKATEKLDISLNL